MQLNFANTTLFEINTEAEVKVEEIGQWKSRVITVDNVFRHPEEMRDWCTTHPSYYENVNTKASAECCKKCGMMLGLL